MLLTYLLASTITPTEQLGKIVKSCKNLFITQTPCRGLITSNEPIQQLCTYMLCGPLLNIVNKNVKNDKKTPIFHDYKS